MNVFVERLGGCNMEDAVAFAQGVMDDAKRIENRRTMSEPVRRALNLALAFMQLKYPFQCCGNEQRCGDCPTTAQHEALKTSWCSPVTNLEPVGKAPQPPRLAPLPSFRRRPVVIAGAHFKSITAAAAELGVHKRVIARMLKDGEAKFVT